MPAQWNPSQNVLEHIARKLPKRLGPGSWWEVAVADEWTKRLEYHPQSATSAQLEDIEDEGPQDEDSQSDDDHDDGQQDQGDQAGRTWVDKGKISKSRMRDTMVVIARSDG